MRLRRIAGITCAAILALAGALLPAPPALADDGPFNVNGTVPDVSPAPAELTDPYGNVKELGPKNSNVTKIGVIHSAATPMLDTTNPNAQVDLRRAWLTVSRDPGTQHDWLYFAWERDSNSGSGFISYEFMKNPAPAACAYDTATTAQLIANCNPWANRAAGDFMILWDQSGGSTALALRTWSGTAPNLTLSAPVPLNSANSAAQYSADGFRGEAAVDLTATIYNGSTPCLAFANSIPSTVTGNSDTADYKDTILRQAPPISNCTSTTVTTPKLADGTTNVPGSGVDLGANGTTVTDSALISLLGGTATPAGSVEFFLCKVDSPGLCTTGGTSVGSANVTGGSFPVTVVSPQTTVTQPGRYCWRAVYSGNTATGIPGSSDSTAGECFLVNAVPSSLTSAQRWVPNDSVTVSATAGGAMAGTVYFDLYASNDCSGAAIYSTSQAVAGASPQTVSTSNTTAQLATGSFSWRVSYDSTNVAQKDIPNSCHETSALTVTNGGTVSSP